MIVCFCGALATYSRKLPKIMEKNKTTKTHLLHPCFSLVSPSSAHSSPHHWKKLRTRQTPVKELRGFGHGLCFLWCFSFHTFVATFQQMTKMKQNIGKQSTMRTWVLRVSSKYHLPRGMHYTHVYIYICIYVYILLCMYIYT